MGAISSRHDYLYRWRWEDTTALLGIDVMYWLRVKVRNPFHPISRVIQKHFWLWIIWIIFSTNFVTPVMPHSLEIANTVVMIISKAVTDPGLNISDRGINTISGTNLLSGQFSPKTAWKWKSYRRQIPVNTFEFFFHNSPVHVIRWIQHNKFSKKLKVGQGLNPCHLCNCQPL